MSIPCQMERKTAILLLKLKRTIETRQVNTEKGFFSAYRERGKMSRELNTVQAKQWIKNA